MDQAPGGDYVWVSAVWACLTWWRSEGQRAICPSQTGMEEEIGGYIYLVTLINIPVNVTELLKKKLLVKYDTFGLFQDKTRKLKIKMNSIQNSKSFNLNNKTGHPSFIKKSDLSPILTRLPELLETITKHASYCCFLMCHLCG